MAASMVLVIEYDGTNYHGSQRQKNLPTVQAELEEALRRLTGEDIRIRTAGRTDSGVHARGQVVGFRCATKRADSTFIKGLNHYLPDDITVRSCRGVADGFDVRRDAFSREYCYLILNRPRYSPLWRDRVWQVSGKLDTAVMAEACEALIGVRNFASFASRLARSNVQSMVRELFEAGVSRHGGLITVRLVGNAFLPHQVRNTVGALVRLGLGRMTIDQFYSIIEAGEPGLAGPGAPACGLYLERVNYPEPYKDI